MRTLVKGKRIQERSTASPFLRRFASKIVEGAQGAPILDVACGSGRNAIFLAQMGCTVFCLDKDLTGLDAAQTRLRYLAKRTDAAGQIVPIALDLEADALPFGASALGGIVNIHYLLPRLFPWFARSLRGGGYLLLETPGRHGGNYLELPRKGALPSALDNAFDIELCREGKAGPKKYDAVTVRLLAKRRRK
jgi:SAM-dependent methyltransferase